MAEWDRDTPWRQGHVLPKNTVKALELVSAEASAESVVVVVSHDCDLAQLPEVEPDVELIVGRHVEALDGNCTHAKSPRRLHLTYEINHRPQGVELSWSGKVLVSKRNLVDHTPDLSFAITPGEKATLQSWLAARYGRAAFPDKFDQRLTTTGLRERLTRLLRPLGNHVVAVFFDIDSGESHERSGPDDPYAVSIYLLYSTEIDPEAAEAAANQAALTIRKAFQDKCRPNSSSPWSNFELIECSPIADAVMTVLDAKRLKRWNADYISLRAEPQQIMLTNH